MYGIGAEPPVAFLDVGAGYRELRAELDAAYRRVMESGRYVLGDEVEAFEREFAAYCGVGHAVGVGNGLEALALVLRAWGVGPGHEVIVPGHTFIATWLAVTSVGARPVPIEPRSGSYNMDAARIEAALTARTRAIVAVHLYGMPADMTAISTIAARHGLPVLEDAAQAHGALHGGRRCGSLGQAAAFSFYPGKNLGAFGDGGAVVTADAALAARVRLLANYGARHKYEHEVPGANSRLDALQAAFLRVRLTRLDEWNARRSRIATHYATALAELPGLGLPEVPALHESAWHLFVVRHDEREALRAHLAGRGIETGLHYPVAIHRSPAFSSWTGPALPRTQRLAETVLSLPIGPHLAEHDVARVSAAVQAFFPSAPRPRTVNR